MRHYPAVLAVLTTDVQKAMAAPYQSQAVMYIFACYHPGSSTEA
jgi:hypothetical protein